MDKGTRERPQRGSGRIARLLAEVAIDGPACELVALHCQVWLLRPGVGSYS